MATGTALTGNSNIVLNIQNKDGLDLSAVLDTLNVNSGCWITSPARKLLRVFSPLTRIVPDCFCT